MKDKTDFIWSNGKMIPWDEAKVHVLSHALHYGTGFFEGIRAYKCVDGSSAVFRLTEHMQRFVNSGKILRLPCPYDMPTLVQAVLDTYSKNKLFEGYCRPLSFVSYGELGVNPGSNPIDTIIAVWPWGAYLGEEEMEMGARLKTSSFARHHVNSMMTKAKTSGNYVNSVLAKMEALSEGYDEAVMLDVNGYVSEASGENIFIIRNGVIKTTPLTSVLDGITRDSIMIIAKDLGYKVEEQMFTRDELYVADEVFCTGTAAEISPVREVDRRAIGTGKAGKITKELQKAYFAAVKGENPKYKHWLTKINY